MMAIHVPLMMKRRFWIAMVPFLDSDGTVCVPCAGTPTDCSNGTTSVVTCDDGDPNTINDMQTILDCDGSVCVPCAGTPVDCSTGTTSVVPCDDGDPCTINDEETILDSDGTVCVPCAGTPTDCSTGTTSVVTCDDGDPNTINDMQTILDCDGSVCVPCAGTPVDCSTGTTSVVPCDDGDPCTINDEETILDSNGTVCVPCAGTPTDCSNGTTSMVACDDGDPCTINDMQTILDCDGSICVPCMGTPTDCSTGTTSVVTCDDGDPCTINDMQTILDCDGSICVPCMGTPTDCSTGTTSVVTCDDGDPCTINDMQTILDCDGSICVPCMGTPTDCSTGTTSVVACDDGDPCTINDMQTILDCDGSICVPCMGTPTDCSTGTISVVACDDGDPCTINDMQTILDCDGSICVPCMGTPTDCATGTTSVVVCDDGNPDTFDDVQTILDCDGSICVPCAGIPCAVQSVIEDPSDQIHCTSLLDGVLLDGSGSTTGSDITYEWLHDNTVIGTDISMLVFEEGIYILQVYDNQSGCESSSQYELIVPEVILEPVIEVMHESCPGDADGALMIPSVSGGQEPYVYALNATDFTSENEFSGLSPGSYTLTIQDVDGCEFNSDIFIEPAPQLFLELGSDQEINAGESFQITTNTNMIVQSALWALDESLSCLDCLEPEVSPTTNTTYTLTLTDENGCTLSDQITISVTTRHQVYLPNSFSPDFDGINDYFMIFGGPEVKIVRQLRVFDRWGATMFAADNFPPNDPQYGWDGTNRGNRMNNGVYIFFAEVEFLDGKTEIFSGDILLSK
jgi:gliding motility-associated-like protein